MKKTIFTILFVTGLLLSNALVAQTVRYVKEGGAGIKNGSSWANASDSLQTMVNASASGDQVWVAAGTYKRNNGDGNSFIMKEGVQVFGGFPKTGTPGMADRIVTTNQTTVTDAQRSILDGEDINRVLYQPTDFTIPTTWDGFIIGNGSTYGNGAGAYLRNKGELKNCLIKDNFIAK